MKVWEVRIRIVRSEREADATVIAAAQEVRQELQKHNMRTGFDRQVGKGLTGRSAEFRLSQSKFFRVSDCSAV